MNRSRWIAWALAAVWAPLACALNPSLHVTQYGHNVWRAQDGLFAPVTAISQTRDGYLWIGTTTDLVRFDGVRFVPWASTGT
ncbi:MAG: two-component regulator propeller domain-containing protein, partial [Rhodanobacteraceae bacterium]